MARSWRLRDRFRMAWRVFRHGMPSVIPVVHVEAPPLYSPAMALALENLRAVADAQIRAAYVTVDELRDRLESENGSISRQCTRLARQNAEIVRAFRSKMSRKARHAYRTKLEQVNSRAHGETEALLSRIADLVDENAELRRKLNPDGR